jgi:glycine/D-amino acid oxidase-like deaminating enzyme/nitrite reductase/ring-hydroxylating ferredoxin subunit
MLRSPDESVPVWRNVATAWPAQALPESAGVCVIGAGISGLTTAYLLQKAGADVLLVDARTPGSGETGRTTAHFTAVLDDRFSRLERLFGPEPTALAASSHRQAIDRVEALVNEESIDCDFERVDGYLMATEDDQRELLAAETLAAPRAGFLDMQPVPALLQDFCVFDRPGLRFPNQAQLHIGKYIDGLGHAFLRLGGKLVTNTRVMSVQGGKGAYIETHGGVRVRTGHIVVATNTPFIDRVTMHTKQYAYRTYVIGYEIPKDQFASRLIWDLEDPYHYARRVRGSTQDVLIVGGVDHKTGQANDAGARYERLERWCQAHFRGLGPVRYRWSGQYMEPADGLAFIGRNPGDDENVYIATGDSGQGMTHGTIAGMLICDLIQGRDNPLEKLYDPARNVMRAAGTFLSENANFVGHMVKDWAKGAEVKSREEIPRGHGAIVRAGVGLIAAYRDTDGVLHERSAVCTHLGCVVQWNGGEKSWDCPCHGSRFAIDGRVLNGPAKSALAAVDDSDTRIGGKESVSAG